MLSTLNHANIAQTYGFEEVAPPSAQGVRSAAIVLGYESEAAFSRAFKRFVGISPGAAWRREPRALHNAAVLPKR